MSPADSTPYLLELPVELVEAIVGLVDLEKDLPALALSCRALLRICLPRWEFEVIHLYHPYELELWFHLARRPEDARRVRALIIAVDRRRLRLPHSVVPNPVGTGFTPLRDPQVPPENRLQHRDELWSVTKEQMCEALKNMQHLTHFEWCMRYDTDYHGSDDIWTVLATCCPKLSTVTFENMTKAQTPVFDSRIVDISNLTSLTITSGAPSKAFSSLDGIVACLARSPHLVSLELHFYAQNQPADSADAFLSAAPLPALESLTIGHVCVGATAMADFLQNHPRLQHLSIWAPDVTGCVDLSLVEKGTVSLTSWDAECRPCILGLIDLARAEAPLAHINVNSEDSLFGLLDADERSDVISALQYFQRHTLKDLEIDSYSDFFEEELASLKEILPGFTFVWDPLDSIPAVLIQR